MQFDLPALRAQAFDYLFDAVVVTDTEGVVIDWNAGSQSLYGYSKAEILGQHVSILHSPEDTESITEQVMSAVAKHGKWSGEIRFKHQDGTIGWIESMCIPLFDEQQQFLGALGINRDITKRIEDAQRLLNLAYYDQLTQMPNRHLLTDRVGQYIERAKRNNSRFCLFYIDLDDFKKVNDSLGHKEGDQVLIEVGRRLNAQIRDADTIARMGGDEFVLMIEGIHDNNDIAAVADTLIACLYKPFQLGEQSVNVNCSIGIATYPDSGECFDSLIKSADFAMYKSKRQGGATYRFS
ncbi:sensor domain-containing diguanylate cyclase [Shewanella sp. 5_MG-2023]|uniref:sensor domain-containing diguanylate cyclase n=1 Tax=Shewanella sp. 5_MG-2023 TaxID=3062656 RepID=UPI0026E2C61A|nr:sensor domain-containing diguanylate cyclase [Shewanella sp. 5_MG-2023]MDO6639902.1 sensor domain-containing diguanylate cyclase [Shewanella sp. 5_MG-2023]